MHANYCFVYLCFALLTSKNIFIVNLFHFYHISRSFTKILLYVSPGMSQKKPGLTSPGKIPFSPGLKPGLKPGLSSLCTWLDPIKYIASLYCHEMGNYYSWRLTSTTFYEMNYFILIDHVWFDDDIK